MKIQLNKVVLISYATPPFHATREELVSSAKSYGFTRLINYTEQDLHNTEFYKANKPLLDQTCGAGFWAWKPYFILKTLETIEDNEIVFYCDAGCKFIQSPDPLIQLALQQDIVLFDAQPLINRQFTKRQCFIAMGCDNPEFHNAPAIIATTLILRKTHSTVTFVQEWLHWCTNPYAINNETDPSIKELNGFLQHRNDQAILSNLAIKFNIKSYRNPSKWGNFLKSKPYRKDSEHVSSPYNIPPVVKTYAQKAQEHSHYGEILEFNRLPNMVGKTPLHTQPRQNLKHKLMTAAKFLYRTVRKKPKPFYKISYSQCGEDLLVSYIFALRGITHPSYIDIGANHPFNLSNTALFYARNCKGLNIEANPELINAFKLHRPNDINLNIGIGSNPGQLPFYVMIDPTFSTFSEQEATAMQKQGHLLKTKILVSVNTLNSIIQNHCNGKFPDFLSLDAEGLDFEIIKSIDFKASKPKVICVEAAEYSPIGAGKRREEMIQYLKAQNYFEYANTNLNAIMVLKDFWFI